MGLGNIFFKKLEERVVEYETKKQAERVDELVNAVPEVETHESIELPTEDIKETEIIEPETAVEEYPLDDSKIEDPAAYAREPEEERSTTEKLQEEELEYGIENTEQEVSETTENVVEMEDSVEQVEIVNEEETPVENTEVEYATGDVEFTYTVEQETPVEATVITESEETTESVETDVRSIVKDTINGIIEKKVEELTEEIIEYIKSIL